MANKVTVTLAVTDVLQIFDALDSRAEAWERTAAVLSGDEETPDFTSEDFFVPEECDDAGEAAEIARHFRDIAADIEAQIGGR